VPFKGLRTPWQNCGLTPLVIMTSLKVKTVIALSNSVESQSGTAKIKVKDNMSLLKKCKFE
jgi:hypothetical protein